MAFQPDVSDPRYLDEVGWFLNRESECEAYEGSYEQERRADSRSLLDEVLRYCGREVTWIRDKRVVSVGCGCTGDLATWPARLKVAVDPLLNVYQSLGMLLEDEKGTSSTIYLAIGAEDLPILDEFADLVVCRNALDHMLHPEIAVREFARIMKPGGYLFLDVDLGGKPKPDEPTVFSRDSLDALIDHDFVVLKRSENRHPNSLGRDCKCRISLQKKRLSHNSRTDTKQQLLQAYWKRIR